MKRLRVGVVGVGALGRHHARIYSQLPDVELVAVADSSAERGTAVAEAAACEWHADYRELFGRVDAVSIAVPTSGHLAVASAFLEREIAVMVEKPLAATLEQAATLVALAQRVGTTLQVGHVERFNPATETARGLCGSPKYIRAERLSPYAFRSTDIGVVLDVMIHDIDLILHFVDSPVVQVDAFGVSILGQHEDCVQARFTFKNGCIADLTANRVNPTSRRMMQLWSARGCVQIDFASREVVRHSPSTRLVHGDSPLAVAAKPGCDLEALKSKIFGEYIQIDRPEVSNADALTAELAHFADCVIHRRTPHVDGHAALAAMEAADRVLKSVAAHRWNGTSAGPAGAFPMQSEAARRAA